MQLEDQGHIRDELMRAATEGDDVLRPVHEFHHLMSVEVVHRYRNGQKTERKLRQQQHQNRNIRKRAVLPNSWVEQAAVQEKAQADKAEKSSDAARRHCQHLFCAV